MRDRAHAYRFISLFTNNRVIISVSSQKFSFPAAVRFIRDTVRHDGFLALWRGNSATMARVIPFAAIQFSAHEQWKHVLHVDRPG